MTSIALVGVGGQGILLASEVIAHAAMLSGLDVKKSEVHGMAQRGGSVVSQVRFGPKVFSPLIPDGEADFLVAFETLEALRHADTLAGDGFALVNSQIITPVTVSSGQQPFPEDVDARLKSAFARLRLMDAVEMAEELGNVRAANTVLTGALSCLLPMEAEVWEVAVAEMVKPEYRDLNLRALAAGRSAMACDAIA